MAKKLPKLTEVTNQRLDADRAIDRKRQQLDELKESRPGSASDATAESSDGGLSVLPGPQKGTGLEGDPDVDDAKDDPSVSPELLEGTAVPGRDRANAPSPFEDDGPKPGDAVAERAGENPDANLVPGVTDAAANPLADAAATGLRGTDSLTTPKADGIQAAPSAQAGGHVVNGLFRQESFKAVQEFTPDAKPVTDQKTGITEFHDGDAVVTVTDNFLAVEVDGELVKVVVLAENDRLVINETRKSSTLITATDNGVVTRETVTTDKDGNTVVTTTTDSNTDSKIEQPDEDDNFVDRDLAQRLAPGQRPGDGDSDDNATDPVDSEIEFGTPTGPVPDLKGSLLGGDNAEPDFGGGGAPTSGPGNVDQTGAIDLGPDALDPLTGGREDDRNLSGNTVEQPPEEEGTDDTDSQSRDLVELRAAIADTPDLDTFALTQADDGNE